MVLLLLWICLIYSILCVPNVRSLSLEHDTMRKKVLPTVRLITTRFADGYTFELVIVRAVFKSIVHTGKPSRLSGR